MEKVERVFKQHLGFARTKDIRKAGGQTRDIARLLKSHVIERIKPGLYKWLDKPLSLNQEFLEVSKAIPQGVICLISALSYHHLTTAKPTVVHLALPKGLKGAKILYPPVEKHWFSQEQYETGIMEVRQKEGKFRIYDAEKTICDCFRYRNRVGEDIAKESIVEYMKRPGKNIDKLLKTASVCRIRKVMEPYLKALS